MLDKQYLNSFINNSATIRDIAAADIADAAHKTIAYSADGKLTLPTADGDPTIGVILSDADSDGSGITKAGTELDVLIKNIGLVQAGEAVKKGDFLTAKSDGTIKKAEAGNYILGMALTEAAAAGEFVQIQITHSGYAK